jgi:hypothetical protein
LIGIRCLVVDSLKNHELFGKMDFVQKLQCCDSNHTYVPSHVQLSSSLWHSCGPQLRLSFLGKQHPAKQCHRSLHQWSLKVLCLHFCAGYCNLHLVRKCRFLNTFCIWMRVSNKNSYIFLYKSLPQTKN